MKGLASSNMRFMAYVWCFFAAISFALGTVHEAYVAMYIVIGAVNAVGADILKEFGR
jgi:hypothetical protein